MHTLFLLAAVAAAAARGAAAASLPDAVVLLEGATPAAVRGALDAIAAQRYDAALDVIVTVPHESAAIPALRRAVADWSESLSVTQRRTAAVLDVDGTVAHVRALQRRSATAHGVVAALWRADGTRYAVDRLAAQVHAVVAAAAARCDVAVSVLPAPGAATTVREAALATAVALAPDAERALLALRNAEAHTAAGDDQSDRCVQRRALTQWTPRGAAPAAQAAAAAAPARHIAPRTAHLLAARTHEPLGEGETDFTLTPPAAAMSYYAVARGGCPKSGYFRSGRARYNPRGGLSGEVSPAQDQIDPPSFDPAHASRVFNFGSSGVPQPLPLASGTLTVRALAEIDTSDELFYFYAHDCERSMPSVGAFVVAESANSDAGELNSDCFERERVIELSAAELAAITAGGELKVFAHVSGAMEASPCLRPGPAPLGEDESFLEVEIAYPCAPEELPGRGPPPPPLPPPPPPCTLPSTTFERSAIDAPPGDSRLHYDANEANPSSEPAPFVTLDFGAVPPPLDDATTATLRIDAHGHFDANNHYLVIYDGSRCDDDATHLSLVTTAFTSDQSAMCTTHSETITLDAALLRNITASGSLRLLALSAATARSDVCNGVDVVDYVKATISYEACGDAPDRVAAAVAPCEGSDSSD